MTAKVRFFPPAAGPWATASFDIPTSSPNAVITISPTAAAFYDAPLMHEQKFIAHSWVRVCDALATADRPAHPYSGQTVFDSDLSEYITFDGVSWRTVAGVPA